MQDHYSREGGDEPIDFARVSASAPGFYAGNNLRQKVCTVRVEQKDGSINAYRVEFDETGPKLEWESSVAYNPKTWEDVLADEKNLQPQTLRVAASLDRYYNYQFSDDNEYLSVHLLDPKTGTSLGNGYISRRSEDGARLRHYLSGATKRAPEQVIVEVRPVTKGKDRRMVEIVRFVKGGFRAAENLALNDQPAEPKK
jgi:hypothetical protein